MKHYRWTTIDPIIYYNKILGNFIHCVDIAAYNNANMIEYQIKDYDTPENICSRLYNDSSLSWILLYLNNIIDPFYDWPLNTNELQKYIINKYGEDNIRNVHHYVKDGYIVNNQIGAEPVTNEEYEHQLNDKKRDILIPTPDLMSSFINSMENLSNE